MGSIIALEGPVESVDGRLALRIPMSLGAQLITSLHGACDVIEDCLRVILPESLGFAAGTMVVVDNRGGEFTISPAIADSEHDHRDWRAISVAPRRRLTPHQWGALFTRH